MTIHYRVDPGVVTHQHSPAGCPLIQQKTVGTAVRTHTSRTFPLNHRVINRYVIDMIVLAQKRDQYRLATIDAKGSCCDQDPTSNQTDSDPVYIVTL